MNPEPNSASADPWAAFLNKAPITTPQAIVWLFLLQAAVTGLAFLQERGSISLPQWLPPSAVQLLLMAGLAGLMLLWWRRAKNAPLRGLGLGTEGLVADLLTFAVAVAAMAGVYALVIGAYYVGVGWFEDDRERGLQRFLWRAVFRDMSVANIVAVCVLYPILEEFWYRAVMYPALRRDFGRWYALVISAVVFALVHNVAWPINQFLGGLVFGYIYERRRGLLAPVLLHMVGNGALVALGWALMRWWPQT